MASDSQIITASDLPAARAAFRKVFHSFEPYGSPFQPSISGRLLIYQTDPWATTPWGLSDVGLDALLKAADPQDLERAFVAVVDPQDNRWDDNLYVLAPLSVDSYLHSPPMEDWSEHQDRDPEGTHRIGDWIPAQLAHVGGPERAEAALRASRLRRWPLPA